MKRRILLLADPSPLISSDTSGDCWLDASCRDPQREPSPQIQIQSGGEYPRMPVQQPITVARDLQHLRRVLDYISVFCRAQQSLVTIDRDTELHLSSSLTVPTAKSETQRAGANPVGDSNFRGTRPQPCLSSSGPRVLLAAVFPCPPPSGIETANDSARESGNVVPDSHDPGDGIGGNGPQQRSNAALGVPEETFFCARRGRCSLELAKAFAGILEDGCGRWLPPEDFEARVLAPTRALIDAQLGDIGRQLLHVLPSATTSPCAAIPVRGDTRSKADENYSCIERVSIRKQRRPSCTSGASSRSRPSLTAKSLALDTPTGLVTAACQPAVAANSTLWKGCKHRQDAKSLGIFIRSAAEEIMLLLREAGVGSMADCGRNEEKRGVRYSEGSRSGDPGGGGESSRESPRALIDVVWAASSLRLKDSFERKEGEERKNEKALVASFAPTSANDTSSSPTREVVGRSAEPNDGFGDGRDEALASGGVGLPCSPAPTLTLSLPSADEAQAEPLRDVLRIACRHSPESRVVIWPAVSNTVDEDGGSKTQDRGGKERVDVPSEKLDVAHMALEEVVAAATDKTLRSEMTGDRAVGVTQEDPRSRLWASWCGSTGARLFFGSPHMAGDSQGSSELVDPVDPGLLWQGPIVGGWTSPPGAFIQVPGVSSLPTPGFPSLEGFALRVVGMLAEGGNRLEIVTGVAASAASILARAPALRLARAISPTNAARFCHLLADRTMAPALELLVPARKRFPGSVSFLDACAEAGRGLLLIAAAPRTSAAVANGGRVQLVNHLVGNEEGLAMVCFPFSRRVSLTACRPAASWSVTLFRRPSEFSEEAVDALLSESGGGARDSIILPPAEEKSVSENSNSTRLPQEGRASGVTLAAVGGERRPEIGGREDESLILETIDSLPVYSAGSLYSEAHRFLEEAKKTPPPRGSLAASLERNVAVAFGAAAVCGNRAKTVVSKPRSAAASQKRRGVELATENTEETTTLSATKRQRAIAAVDLWAARLRCVDLGDGRDHANGDGLKPRGSSSVSAAAIPSVHAIYASFGAWQGPGGRLSWAEEALLPGADRLAGMSGSNGVLAGRSASPSRNGSGLESGAGGLLGGRECGLLETRAKSSSDPRREERAQAAAEREEASAPSRSLSTAEQVLEKAGEKQRARKKQRRMVAREQRARMDRPRPRPRSRLSATSSTASIGMGKGIGGGIYRRGGLLAPPVCGANAPATGPTAIPGIGALGRAVQGSKLCRGSLILGRSVSGASVDAVGAADPALMARSSETSPEVEDLEAFREGNERSGRGMGARATDWRGTTRSRPEASKKPPGAVGMGSGRRITENRPARGDGGATGWDRVRRAIFGGEEPASVDATNAEGATKVVDRGRKRGGADRRNGIGDGLGDGVQSPAEADRERVTHTIRGKREGGTAMTVMAEWRGEDDGSAAARGRDGLAGGGNSSMRQVMERAMLAAIASQMSLPEGDPRVRAVFERESRRMGGTGTGGSSW